MTKTKLDRAIDLLEGMKKLHGEALEILGHTAVTLIDKYLAEQSAEPEIEVAEVAAVQEMPVEKFGTPLVVELQSATMPGPKTSTPLTTRDQKDLAWWDKEVESSGMNLSKLLQCKDGIQSVLGRISDKDSEMHAAMNVRLSQVEHSLEKRNAIQAREFLAELRTALAQLASALEGRDPREVGRCMDRLGTFKLRLMSPNQYFAKALDTESGHEVDALRHRFATITESTAKRLSGLKKQHQS